MSQYAGKKVLVSAIEHDAVLAPAAQFISAQIPVSEQGIINVIALQAMLDDDVVLVSCMYANNEVGTVQPIAEMSRVIAAERKRRRNLGNTTPIYFHTDACQASNYLNMQVSRLGVDLLTINGGKMYGPKQSGALFCKVGVPLQPIIVGGGQERGMRSGTENIANAVGLAHAFTQAQEMRRTEVGRLKTLQAEFLTRLAGAVPWAPVNGSRKHRLPNNVHVTIPGVDNESLLIQLEEKSILAAAGSACSASNGEPSHVLRAMGISDDAAKSSVRFTMGRHTTLEQVIATVDALALYC